MAMTNEQIKTIAITSAIAAGATAAATAGVGYLLERYVLKQEAAPAGPTFVVVPVVQAPVPSDIVPPPANGTAGFGRFGGFGSLSAQTEANMRAALPVCWSTRFDKCIEDEHRYDKGCIQYEPIHVAYEEDKRTAPNPQNVAGGGKPLAYRAIIRTIGECDYSKTSTAKFALLAAGGGIAVGLLLGSAMIGRA